MIFEQEGRGHTRDAGLKGPASTHTSGLLSHPRLLPMLSSLYCSAHTCISVSHQCAIPSSRGQISYPLCKCCQDCCLQGGLCPLLLELLISAKDKAEGRDLFYFSISFYSSVKNGWHQLAPICQHRQLAWRIDPD